ncbi:hypothetical protein [Syntrophomonas erecta]
MIIRRDITENRIDNLVGGIAAYNRGKIYTMAEMVKLISPVPQ